MNWSILFSACVSLVGIASPIFFHSLDKEERFVQERLNDAFRMANLSSLALVASPILVHLLLVVIWRQRVPFMNFIVAVLLSAVVSWGQMVDYMAWKGKHYPLDQVTYLAGFLAVLVAWGIWVGYVVVVLGFTWLNRPRVAVPAN